MRKLIFVVLTVAVIAGLMAFTMRKAAAKNLYVVIYTPGSGWDQAKQPAAQAHFQSHGQRLQAMRKENKIILGARYGDKGMIVIPADTEEEVRAWVFGDSAVISKTFQAEVHPYNVFYYGCLEKPQ